MLRKVEAKFGYKMPALHSSFAPIAAAEKQSTTTTTTATTSEKCGANVEENGGSAQNGGKFVCVERQGFDYDLVNSWSF